MDYEIEFINSTTPSHNYSEAAVSEYEAGLGDGIDKYTEAFEQATGVREGEDIGGLIVYAEGARVVAVYDYENFYGWVV